MRRPWVTTLKKGPEGRRILAGGKRSAAPGQEGILILRPGGAREWWRDCIREAGEVVRDGQAHPGEHVSGGFTPVWHRQL